MSDIHLTPELGEAAYRAATAPTIGHNSGEAAPIINFDLAVEIAASRAAVWLARKNELLAGFARWQTKTISDDVMQGRSADFVKQINETLKKIEAARKETKEPVIELGKAVDAAFAGYSVPLSDAKATIERAMTAYAKQRAAEELARARAEAERLAAQQAEAAALAAAEAEMLGEAPVDAPEPVQAALPTMTDASRVSGDYGSTASLRGRWTFTVEDASKVPAQYMMVNPDAIKAAIKGGARDIPGVKIYLESKVSVR